MKNWFPKNIPSFVWILIFIGGIVLFIGSIILFFLGISTVEGFGSGIVILLAFITILVSKPNRTDISNSFITAIAVLFFALMATVIDQPGNVIYNKPIEIIFCKPDTYLSRSADISHPLPGRTDITQDFRCYDNQNNVRTYINPLQVLMVRFGEYILFMYAVIYIIKFKHILQKNNTKKSDQ